MKTGLGMGFTSPSSFRPGVQPPPTPGNPRTSFDFAPGTMPGEATYTRAGNATHIKPSDGSVETLGTDVAPFESVSGAQTLRYEPAATNLHVNANRPDLATLIGSNVTFVSSQSDPAGGSAAMTVRFTTDSIQNFVEQVISLPAFADVIFSFWARRVKGNDRCLTRWPPGALFTPDPEGDLIIINDAWNRYSYSRRHDTSAEALNCTFRNAHPNFGHGGDGSLDADLWGFMVEAANDSGLPSSVIITSGSTVVRNEPNLHFNAPDGLWDVEILTSQGLRKLFGRQLSGGTGFNLLTSHLQGWPHIKTVDFVTATGGGEPPADTSPNEGENFGIASYRDAFVAQEGAGPNSAGHSQTSGTDIMSVSQGNLTTHTGATIETE